MSLLLRAANLDQFEVDAEAQEALLVEAMRFLVSGITDLAAWAGLSEAERTAFVQANMLLNPHLHLRLQSIQAEDVVKTAAEPAPIRPEVPLFFGQTRAPDADVTGAPV